MDHFTKDTYNQRLKFPNSLPNPFYPEKQSSTEQRESALSSGPATHSLKNYRASGNRKKSYIILQPFTQNILNILPSTSKSIFRKLPGNIPVFADLPHTVSHTFCFVFCTLLFCLLYLSCTWDHCYEIRGTSTEKVPGQ